MGWAIKRISAYKDQKQGHKTQHLTCVGTQWMLAVSDDLDDVKVIRASGGEYEVLS